MDKDKLSFGQALMNKVTEVLGYSVNADKKLNQLHAENVELKRMIQGMNRMGIKSTIPYMTPKQLVSLAQRGWSINEISDISGYEVEQVITKINSYQNV